MSEAVPARTTRAKPAQDVAAFLDALDHPLRAEIETVRALIHEAEPRLAEHIKWNAPSFHIAGEDRVTFRLHPPTRLELIFHRGVKPKDTTGFTFEDASGLTRWAAPDRAVVTLEDKADIEAKSGALQQLVRQWIEATGGS